MLTKFVNDKHDDVDFFFWEKIIKFCDPKTKMFFVLPTHIQKSHLRTRKKIMILQMYRKIILHAKKKSENENFREILALPN